MPIDRTHRRPLRPFLTAFALLAAFVIAAPAAPASDTATQRLAVSPAPSVKVRSRIPQFPADVKARGDRLWSAASPAAKPWTSQQAPGIATGAGDPEALARAAAQARWPKLRAAGGYDAITFLLLYEAARNLQARLKNDLDSMSEMGEMESLRLQMAMDRLSKLMSTLSNLLKKLSDTGESIVHNLK